MAIQSVTRTNMHKAQKAISGKFFPRFDLLIDVTRTRAFPIQ